MRRKASLKKPVPSGKRAYRMGGKLKKGGQFFEWLDLLRDKTTPLEEEMARINRGQRIRGRII